MPFFFYFSLSLCMVVNVSSVRLALIISKVQCSSGTSVLLRVYRIALVDCLGHRGLQKIQKRDFTGGQTDRLCWA